MRDTGFRVEDVDVLAAFGVVVWVGGVVHHGDGERGDRVGVGTGDPAGSEAGVVVGYGASVGGCRGDEGEEREEEEEEEGGEHCGGGG